MTTTKITIKPHLKEYIIGKYNEHNDSAVTFPDELDLYHLIWDLAQIRPVNCPVDKGNLEIVLPDRRLGKSPETYNYLGLRSQHIIQKKIETMFWAELHEYLDDAKHRNKDINCDEFNYIEFIWIFIRKYNLQSISEDALLKNYQRWKDVVRKRKKRAYKNKNNRQSV